MILLDSNIVIYAGQAPYQWLKHLLQPLPSAVSVATRIEVMGYHRLTLGDRADLELFFSARVKSRDDPGKSPTVRWRFANKGR